MEGLRGNTARLFMPALPFTEIEERLHNRSCILIPIASLEPYGPAAGVGCGVVSCTAIAEGLCRECGVLMAPPLWYAHSTPYRAFGGAIGLKRKHLVTAMLDILRDCAVQGVSTVILLDGSYESHAALLAARRRIAGSHPAMRVEVMAWQHEPVLRAMVEERTGRACHGRLEFGIVSMAAYVDPTLVETRSPAWAAASGEPGSAWRKRGSDPEKLRKLIPSGSACSLRPDPAFGKALLTHLLEAYGERVRVLLARKRGNGQARL
jgi:creatinine amidohydrolase/Fe(II)-dependent formamide hydrolase-like protein